MVSLSIIDASVFLRPMIQGQWRGEIPIPSATSLEESEENFKGSDQRAFLEFMRKMLQWRPEDRQTAGQLLQDPWLNAASYE
jgi:serine/threonine-protein kinase SRPK3